MLPENTHHCQMWWRCKTCRDEIKGWQCGLRIISVKQQNPLSRSYHGLGISQHILALLVNRIYVPNYNCGNQGKNIENWEANSLWLLPTEQQMALLGPKVLQSSKKNYFSLRLSKKLKAAWKQYSSFSFPSDTPVCHLTTTKARK